ncbi:GNAT family N-acetyltransferase [Microbacterium sp. NEAU-LLC]|uniref:GNAT family N-acetyltransferase n=1 Tax=Microbacterium helvum TaxID=2773713 RepID=A0ABR8NPD3_9MICO|nr:GNAT family N-acetyltransferase [Microbacterium helvum]MBD3942489.1 GNAT family N-acetyltransferase [Microbacterium helvum]
MVRIRPLAEQDVSAVDALWDGDAVPFGGAATQLSVFSSVPGRVVVAEDDHGAILGHASLLRRAAWRGAYAPFRVRVTPTARGAGIGRALWEALAPEREAWESGRFVTSVDRDDPESRRTAARHGGAEVGLHIVSRLDLTASPPATQPPDPRARVHHPDLADRAERDRLYRFLTERGEDAPDAGPGVVLLQREMFDAWFTQDWQAVVLRIADEDVALTTAMGDGDAAHIVFTGVVPAHRGRGLATWVKQVHADEMRRRGFRTLRTENMADNAAILAVNARAGFHPVAGYVDIAFDPA